MLFFQLLLDPVALEGRQIIDEQLAVEVIAFVLNAHRQQAFGNQLEGLAVTVEGLDFDFLRAIDVFVEARHRQAAFLILLNFVGQGLELGVDKHQRFILVFGQVHHHQALVYIHLGGRQADAGGVVHGCKHIVDQLAQLVVDLLHRFGDGTQARIGKFEDVQDRHMRL